MLGDTVTNLFVSQAVSVEPHSQGLSGEARTKRTEKCGTNPVNERNGSMAEENANNDEEQKQAEGKPDSAQQVKRLQGEIETLKATQHDITCITGH